MDTNVKMSAVPEPNKMSIDDFSKLVNGEQEVLLDFLADLGVIAKSQTCSNCGDKMWRFFDKSKNQTFWICTKSKNGVKCKGGKFSIRKGTFLQNVHLSIQQVLWYIWHFVHKLSVKQCREYMSIGKYNKETVVEAYKSCRAICNDWIRENFEPLGGFGTIVEFDESYFSGAPKYGRGGRGHAPSWEEENPWVFGIVQRGSLDCWLQQVTNRRRTTLVPILNSRLKQGSVLCSDKWGAYKELEQHLTVEDCEHFTVNHKKNFVDPDTGAYTQTVEGMWRHMKVFLPPYGIPPRYLDSYLGAFMWIRYAKQRDLDLFIYFLECAAEQNRPFISGYKPVDLPSATITNKRDATRNNKREHHLETGVQFFDSFKKAKTNTQHSQSEETLVRENVTLVDLTSNRCGEDDEITEF